MFVIDEARHDAHVRNDGRGTRSRTTVRQKGARLREDGVPALQVAAPRTCPRLSTRTRAWTCTTSTRRWGGMTPDQVHPLAAQPRLRDAAAFPSSTACASSPPRRARSAAAHRIHRRRTPAGLPRTGCCSATRSRRNWEHAVASWSRALRVPHPMSAATPTGTKARHLLHWFVLPVL